MNDQPKEKTLSELAEVEDKNIDFSDIPELDDNFWKRAKAVRRNNSSFSSVVGWLKNRRTHLLIFGMGLVIGGWLEFAFLVSWDVFWKKLEDWQTLVGALAATTVGGLSVPLIIRQIKIQRNVAAEERARHWNDRVRRAMSLRSHLPDALAALSDYLDECKLYIVNCAGGREFTVPNEPQEAIATIKFAIEYMDNDTAQVMMEMVIHYQIHNARLEFLVEDFVEHSPVAETLSVAERMYDLVKLSYMVGRLFPFARVSVGAVIWEAPTKEKILEIGKEFFSEFLDVGEVPANEDSVFRPLDVNTWNTFEACTQLHTKYPTPQIDWENSF